MTVAPTGKCAARGTYVYFGMTLGYKPSSFQPLAQPFISIIIKTGIPAFDTVLRKT